jgi:tRNA 2-thiouridine synthesizing protein A
VLPHYAKEFRCLNDRSDDGCRLSPRASTGVDDGSEARTMTTSRSHLPVVVDARGLRCPINWAKAKVRLESVARGTVVEVLVDDPRSRRDLPVAAEAEGYAVLEIEDLATHLRILIEK